LKLTVSRETFLSRLGIAVRGVSTRSAIQTLSGVLLRVETDSVELQATDMELGVRVALKVSEASEGTAVLPGRLFLDVVRSLPKDELSLEYRSAQQDVELVSGPARFHLRTLPVEDFPKLPEAPSDGVLTVPAAAFVETIARVARSASRDETRPHLTGVLVSAAERELRMVATDSYRLSVKETELDQGPKQELEAIVPARALAELSRIGQTAESATLDVGVQENQIVFGVDGVWLTARRIDGQFPNYRQLLPEQFEAEVQVPREELLDVVRRTGLLAQRKSPLRLRFEAGELTVSAQTQDVGEARESLPVSYAGETLEIGFNADFLRDGLESVTDDTVRLKLISPLRPGLIHGENDDFLYLIMPIRLAG
jgi:DNA polymerase III subunit beta